jgi:hypothetical protein
MLLIYIAHGLILYSIHQRKTHYILPSRCVIFYAVYYLIEFGELINQRQPISALLL